MIPRDVIFFLIPLEFSALNFLLINLLAVICCLQNINALFEDASEGGKKMGRYLFGELVSLCELKEIRGIDYFSFSYPLLRQKLKS